MDTSKSFLDSFYIFNCIPPRSEGADPEVYYVYSNNDETDSHVKLITGIIMTFLSFCLIIHT